MPQTKPPCFNEGTGCAYRYIGCHADCPRYHAWLIVHAKEAEEERQRRYADREVDGVLMQQGKRIRRQTAEKSAAKKRRGLR